MNKVNQWLTNMKRTYSIDSSGNDQGRDATTVAIDHNNGGVNPRELQAFELNAANVRTLFAADKLLEVTRRAGKHYDAQTLAHFGVQVPDMIEGQAIRLGHHSQDIIIGDVVSTAQTDSTPLGEIAGKGYSAQGSKPVDFTAPCHGVLMAIYSCVPNLDYYQEGMDKLNALIEKSDFFIPEYDNLGMQPLFGYQAFADMGQEIAPMQGYKPETWNTSILGWQYRYMEFKQKFNRIFGGLKYTQKHWTVGRNSGDAAASTADKYYHDPGALNTVMEYPYLGGWDDNQSPSQPVDSPAKLYERDPLIHEIFFDVKKASKKSPYGLMNL